MDETPERPVTIRHYRQLANEIIEKHFGKPPQRIAYKRSGRTNFVFTVNHVEGQFVVRISPDLDRIEAFKKDVDVTLLRENLRLTVEQRVEKLSATLELVEELRSAGREARRAARGTGV